MDQPIESADGRRGPFFRIAMAARPDAGLTSLSWRVKEALEGCGHTVFYFTPERWPWLFDESGALVLGRLARFVEVSGPDVLLACDGVGVSLEGAGERLAAGLPVGVLAGNRAQLAASAGASGEGAFGFALAVGSAEAFGAGAGEGEGAGGAPSAEGAGDAGRAGASAGAPAGGCACLEGVEGFGAPVYLCPACPDGAYLRKPLANDVACPLDVVCLQDATPARLAFMRELAGRPEAAGVGLRCFGRGWPAPFAADPAFSAVTYAARSAAACAVFEGGRAEGGAHGGPAPEDALLTEARLALVRADGARVVRVAPAAAACAGERPAHAGGPAEPSADARPADSEPAAQGAALPPALALDALAALVAQAKAACPSSQPRSRRTCGGYAGPLLEDGLTAALQALHRRYAPRGLMPGSDRPRTVVCVLGYFGMGNFGDEYILASLVRRVHERVPGSTVVAVGENPEHTLRARGVYSLTLADKHALDEALAHSSGALVAAGLLFDQGIRWTMGKAELMCDMPHTDIPGIAAFVELAWLNSARPVFYGAGAGPLDVAAGRSLVRLMGRLDTLFLVRDAQTGRLIESCGVPAGQVRVRADAAFMGGVAPTAFVREWLGREGVDLSRSRLVAVSLREYENVPADFASRVARALDRVAAGQLDVEFAACVLDPSDLPLAREVRAAMASSGRLHVFDAGEAIEPVADLLSRSSAGLSMRYHCSLLLAASGVPCVGLGYLPKVASLYRDLGQEASLLAMDADAGQVAEGLLALLAGGEGRGGLRERVEGLRALAARSEDELVEVVGSVAPQKAFSVPGEFFLRDVSVEEVGRRGLARQLEEAQAQARQLACERDEARHEVEEVRASWSYRLGNLLLKPLSALKRALGGRDC